MKLKRIALLMALILACSAVFAGCKQDSAESEPSSSDITLSDLLSQAEESSKAEASQQPSDTSSEAASSDQGTSSDVESSEVSDASSEGQESSAESSEPESYPSIITTESPSYYDAVMVVGDAAFEYYSYSDAKAQSYASIVNKAAEKLSGVSTVYDMIIPNSMGVTLPDNLMDQNKSSDCAESLNGLYSHLSDAVVPVKIYDTLMRHREEYIYFRTDHHWTATGAYYAYEELCKVKGVTAPALTDYRQRDFTGFLGSFYKDTGKLAALGDNPDTVTAYYPIHEDDIKFEFTDVKGNCYAWPIIFNAENSPADIKYSCFAGSDNPYAVSRNAALDDGSSCIIIKESFGNALVPFLADRYQTVYEIDYRYWTGNIVQFAKEHNVDDVIFANNISMTRSDYLIGKLSQIVG